MYMYVYMCFLVWGDFFAQSFTMYKHSFLIFFHFPLSSVWLIALIDDC